MPATGKLRRSLAPLVPDSIARRLVDWRVIARGAMPEADWRRDWRRGIANVAQYERMRIARETGRVLGRAPLASLRCVLDEGSAALEPAPLGWVFAEGDLEEPASLRMRPGASVSYRLRAEPGTRLESRLRAEQTVAPNTPGVEFVVVARDRAGVKLGRWSRHLGATGEGTIGSLSLRLPDAAERGIVLELATGAEGAPADAPERAVWIDPCLVSPRAGDDGPQRFPGSRPPRARPATGAAEPAPEIADPAAAGRPPRFSILTPVNDPNPLFLDRALASVRRQTRSDWELCIHDDASSDPDVRELIAEHRSADPRIRSCRGEAASGIAGATNAALAIASGEFVLLLDHDDELEPNALAAIAAALEQFPGADMVYTDEATIDHDNTPLANFLKPAWSPEFFESNMYTCHFGAYRRSLVEELGGFRSKCDGSQDYDLVLRLSERTAAIVHSPGVRYFWRTHPGSALAGGKPYAFTAAERALGEHFARVGRPGSVKSMRLRGAYRRAATDSADRVAVILAVPADAERGGELATCLGQLAGVSGADVELVCVAGGTAPTEACRATAADREVEATVIEGPALATRAELLDLATTRTEADAFVLCAEPVARLSEGWLAEMLTVAAIPGVGMVGSLGLSPGGRIERAGVVMADGLPLVADLDEPLAFDDPERVSASQTCVRNFSAASGTVLVRRETLERIGGVSAQGFDQLAEADLCLRAREAGLRVAVTPLARLGRASARSWAAETDLGELFRFQRRWWSRSVDPYYHPVLCAQRAVFSHPHRPSPASGWRRPTADGEPASDGLAPGPREELAAAYLRGSGLEIGALHSPLRVPPAATVRYVDRMPVTLLRRHYPELAALPLVEVDVLDDGERLDTVATASQDFVIANHLLEHTGDPIATIGNWLRVLRPGGVIYLAVPDKRFSFDIEREVTPLEHIIRDHEDGPDVSRRQHFEEWARHVERVPEERVGERADALERLDYSVHTHVFTERELLELLIYCDERVGPIEIEAVRRNGLETIVVLRKPDPSLPPPEPARAYDELPEPDGGN